MRVTNLKFAAAAALTVGVAACSGDIGTNASEPSGRLANSYSYAPNIVQVCKYGTKENPGDPNVSGTFTVTSSNGGGVPNSGITLTGGNCATAFTGDGVTATTITITETPGPGSVLDSIVVTEPGKNNIVLKGQNFATVTLPNSNGYSVWFKNRPGDTPPPPPPPPGSKGCTPGFWKNSPGSWVGYATTDKFETVFARNAFSGDPSLMQALGLNGGGLNALARHATAALLNASQGFYPYTTAEVIAKFQAAYDSGNYEAQKNDFDAKNNLGCPLANDNSF